jgi:quercetin dioxygenase-like cupin family protein
MGMSRRTIGIVGAALGLTVCAIGTSIAAGPDPLEVGKDIYTKRFENDRVRVSTIHFAPDASIPMHEHQWDHFVYIIKPGKLRLTHADGTTTEAEGKAHDVMWMPAESHSAVNIGGTDFEAIVVELKK